MKERKHTRRIIFHHSLSTIGDVHSIRQWHIIDNGWEDIGYHYVIKTDGTIQPGRGLMYIGAHAAGRNADSVGVCLIGNFHISEPTVYQLNAVTSIVHDLSHMIIYGWNHPLKLEFHRPHICNIFEPLAYGMINACPGKLLDRPDFLEIVKRGNM